MADRIVDTTMNINVSTSSNVYEQGSEITEKNLLWTLACTSIIPGMENKKEVLINKREREMAKCADFNGLSREIIRGTDIKVKGTELSSFCSFKNKGFNLVKMNLECIVLSWKRNRS